jgi:ATPase subunit of ABC transporter with duplicated ATPase domains
MSKEEGAPINWANQDDLYKTFPVHIQEQIALARAKNVSKTVDLQINLQQPLSSNYLLRDARLFLEPNKRICLVGEPSSGKSTLLHAIVRGAIKDFPKHLMVHHCHELEETKVPISCVDAVVESHEFRTILLNAEKEIKKAQAAGPSADDADGLKKNLELVTMHLTKIRSDDAHVRAAKMLRVLGFDDAKQACSTNSLSGGLRMRVALCSAFFIEADLLLLDEPTNHLDFPSVLWLENRLRGYKCAFLLISHDRELLENVCTSIIRINEKKLDYFNCGFAEFEKKLAIADKKKDEMIDKFMATNRNVDPSTQKARTKAEYKLWQETYQAKMIQLAGKFTFPDIKPLAPLPTDPKDPRDISLIKMTDVRFSYDEKAGLPFIFPTPTSINVTGATRMGVMGPNGAGKSTLLKLLTKRLIPTTGKVEQHPTATIAYFAQHHAAELNLEQTPADYMGQQFPDVTAALLRKHLAKIGLVGPMQDTRMQSLSHGQRSCVIFAKITFVCPHLLIMDEPTNFLDLESIDALIAATNKYTGGLLLVSHNRVFLKKCAKQYLSVVPGSFNIYDDLKTCERATYSFIADLEEGSGAGKIGASALQNSKTHAAATAAALEAEAKAKEAKEKGIVEEKVVEKVVEKEAPKETAKVAAPADKPKGPPQVPGPRGPPQVPGPRGAPKVPGPGPKQGAGGNKQGGGRGGKKH